MAGLLCPQNYVHFLSPTANGSWFPPGAANMIRTSFRPVCQVAYAESLLWTVRVWSHTCFCVGMQLIGMLYGVPLPRRVQQVVDHLNGMGLTAMFELNGCDNAHVHAPSSLTGRSDQDP